MFYLSVTIAKHVLLILILGQRFIIQYYHQYRIFFQFITVRIPMNKFL